MFILISLVFFNLNANVGKYSRTNGVIMPRFPIVCVRFRVVFQSINTGFSSMCIWDAVYQGYVLVSSLRVSKRIERLDVKLRVEKEALRHQIFDTYLVPISCERTNPHFHFPFTTFSLVLRKGTFVSPETMFLISSARHGKNALRRVQSNPFERHYCTKLVSQSLYSGRKICQGASNIFVCFITSSFPCPAKCFISRVKFKESFRGLLTSFCTLSRTLNWRREGHERKGTRPEKEKRREEGDFRVGFAGSRSLASRKKAPVSFSNPVRASFFFEQRDRDRRRRTVIRAGESILTRERNTFLEKLTGRQSLLRAASKVMS